MDDGYGAGRPLSGRVTDHLRSNVVGYIALFCFVIGGSASALSGKNDVKSDDIKAENVKTSDLDDKAVTKSKLDSDSVSAGKLADGAVGGEHIADGAVAGSELAPDSVSSPIVQNNSLTGADINEGSLNLNPPDSLPPSGPAGGDLSGDYPNPQVQESGLSAGGEVSGTLNSLSVANNALGDGEFIPADEDEITDGTIDSQDIHNGNTDIVIGASEIGTAALLTGSSPDFIHVGAAPALRFDNGVDDAIELAVTVPQDATNNFGTPQILWSSGTTTGNVTWKVETLYLTPGAAGEEVTDTPSSLSGSFPVTGGSDVVQASAPGALANTAAPGDLMLIRITRDGDAVSDTHAGSAALHAVSIRFQTDR